MRVGIVRSGRVLALLLAFGLMSQTLGAQASELDQEDLKEAGNKTVSATSVYNDSVSVYQWERIDSVSELGDYLRTAKGPLNNGTYPVLVLWENGSTPYFLGASQPGMHKENLQGYCAQDTVVAGAARFDTYVDSKAEAGNFCVDFSGWQQDEGFDRYETKIKIGGSQLYWEYSENGKFDLGSHADGNYGNKYGDYWVVERGKDNSKFRIFANVPGGSDTAFVLNNNCIKATKKNAPDEGNVYLYKVAAVKSVDRFKDNLTFKESDTFSIGTGTQVLLREGGTMTVEEGALLSVSGTLFLQGKIINRGTILVNKGGCISTYASRFLDTGNSHQYGNILTSGEGSITCEGAGSLIVLDGGSVIMDGHAKGGLTFERGGGCLNFGTIMAGTTIRVDGGNFYNRSTGCLFLGYQVTGGRATDNPAYVPSVIKKSVSGSTASLSKTVIACSWMNNSVWGYGQSYCNCSSSRFTSIAVPANADERGLRITGGGRMVNEGHIMANSPYQVDDGCSLETREDPYTETAGYLKTSRFFQYTEEYWNTYDGNPGKWDEYSVEALCTKYGIGTSISVFDIYGISAVASW